MNRIVDPAVSIDALIADPVEASAADGGSVNSHLPLPGALYPDRANSRGLDFSSETELTALQEALAAAPRTFASAPMLAGATRPHRGRGHRVAQPGRRATMWSAP